MPKSSRVTFTATRRRSKAKSTGSRSRAAASPARTKAARSRKRPVASKAKAVRRPARAAAPARASRAAATARPAASGRSAGSDRALRNLLIAQLDGGHAHATLAQALEGFPAETRGVRPDGAAHSAWQVLEHVRISQWDIVEFTRDPGHRSPSWPTGYWPTEEAPPNASDWDSSVRAIERELGVMKHLLRDPDRPLFTQVAHPEAKPHHTLAREAMVLAVHNGYHIAELIVLRRLLGTWPG